jgi:hypothetical protein
VQISDWDKQSVVFASSIRSSLLTPPGRPATFPALLPWLPRLADLELPFLDLFRQLDAADDDRCRSETLRSQHRAESVLHNRDWPLTGCL